MGVFKKDDYWWIDYVHDRKRHRKKISTSKKMADSVLSKIKTDIAQRRYLELKEDATTKFKDFAVTYLEKYAKPNKRTWDTDELHIKSLNTFFGELYLFQIKPELIEQYKSQRKEKVAVATVNRALAVLKGIFNRAIDWGITDTNPVRKVKMFKENNARVRFLTEAEIATLLSNCTERLRTVVVLALNTGMRKAEIQNLKWQDIDFDNGIITLHHTKNGEKRFVPMNQAVINALNAFPKYQTSPYIFCNEKGTPYNFRKSFETAMRKSGIFDFKFHDLRHTFASHLVMRGIDLNTVRELMGHKTINMTLRYAHLSPDHKAKAVHLLSLGHGTPMTPSVIEVRSEETVGLASSLN